MTLLPAMLLAQDLWIEGESPAEQKGWEGEDRKFAACGLQCLGRSWGARRDHYAQYRVALKKERETFVKWADLKDGATIVAAPVTNR